MKTNQRHDWFPRKDDHWVWPKDRRDPFFQLLMAAFYDSMKTAMAHSLKRRHAEAAEEILEARRILDEVLLIGYTTKQITSELRSHRQTIAVRCPDAS